MPPARAHASHVLCASAAFGPRAYASHGSLASRESRTSAAFGPRGGAVLILTMKEGR